MTTAPTGRPGGRALSVPLRRGTARRLGITQPTPDLTAWHRSFTAALEEIAVERQVLRDAVRRAFGGQALTSPGPCGNRSPQLFGYTPLTCTLRAGHEGMHESYGTSWGVPS